MRTTTKPDFSVLMALNSCLSLFSRGEKVKLSFYTVSQMLLGFLDLLGVALLGILGSLSVSGVQSIEPNGQVASALKFIGLANYSLQGQVAILACISATALASKTLISMFITRRNLTFLSQKSADISIILLNKLLHKNLIELRKNNSQTNLFSVSQGVTSLTNNVLGSFISLFSDVTLLIILFSGLLYVNYISAIATVLFFLLIGLVLHRVLSVKIHEISNKSVENTISLNSMILEMNRAYKELLVKNRRSHYLKEISELRNNGATFEAKLSFMPFISKYVLDISLIVGALLISGLQFFFGDARQAVGSLLIFLVAAMRIGPAVLRIQQGALSMKNGTATSQFTIALINKTQLNVKILESEKLETTFRGDLKEFDSQVNITGLQFRYKENANWELSCKNLEIPASCSVAIVGASGAGKTTFVDLLLGIIPPDSGKIEISGLSPSVAVSRFPGMISYVPQDVFIKDGSVRQNVALGYPPLALPDSQIYAALEMAQLSELVHSLPGGLDFQVGENGSNLSGGQRQRLGIARALVSSPKLIVMDEATSALDNDSEQALGTALRNLPKEVTLLVIAHRVTTVENCDLVLFMDNGKVIFFGTIEDAAKVVPMFSDKKNLS